MNNRELMYKKSAVTCIIALAVVALATVSLAQGKGQPIGPVKVTAANIDITSSKWTLSGGPPQVWTEDGRYNLKATRIVVDLRVKPASGQAKLRAADRVELITATGSVTASVKTPDNSAQVTASKAVFYPSENKLVCEGSVVAVVTDPNTEEPSRLEAQRITYWYDPDTTRSRIVVEGAPAQMRVVPKPKAGAKGAQ